MAYEVRLTNGTILTSIDDGTKDDTSSSITFIGKRYADYGQIFNQNTVEVLENFANTIPPSSPLNGQIWFDSSTSAQALKVFVNDTVGWRALGFTNLLQESTIVDDIIFSGTVTFSGVTDFSGPSSFSDSLALSGNVAFNNATWSGDVTSTATIIQDGSTVFNGPSSFNGGVSYPSAVTYDSAAQFNGAVDIINTLEVLGTITSESAVVSTGAMYSSIGYYTLELTANVAATGTQASVYSKKDIGQDLSTILFLDCTGTEGATSITDTSAGTASNGGSAPDNTVALTNATVDIYRGRQSGGTLNFNGTTAYATITDNINYDLSVNEFVMDGWFYAETASAEQVLMAKGTAITDRWEIYITATGTLAFNYHDGVDSIAISGGSVSAFDWSHWALERETSGLNAIFTLYLNGNRVGQATVTSASYDFDDITSNVVIGRRGYGTFEYFNGNMDDIRIKKIGTGYNGAFKPREIPVSKDGVIAFTNVAGKSYTLEFVEEKW